MSDIPKPPKPPRRKQNVAELLKNAQMSVLADALMAFVEQVDGKVGSDEEIIREGEHVMFPPEVLGAFEKDNQTFRQFYIWRRTNVVAVGFLNPHNLTALSIVRVAPEDWPLALKLHIQQRAAKDSP